MYGSMGGIFPLRFTESFSGTCPLGEGDSLDEYSLGAYLLWEGATSPVGVAIRVLTRAFK